MHLFIGGARSSLCWARGSTITSSSAEHCSAFFLSKYLACSVGYRAWKLVAKQREFKVELELRIEKSQWNGFEICDRFELLSPMVGVALSVMLCGLYQYMATLAVLCFCLQCSPQVFGQCYIFVVVAPYSSTILTDCTVYVPLLFMLNRRTFHIRAINILLVLFYLC